MQTLIEVFIGAVTIFLIILVLIRLEKQKPFDPKSISEEDWQAIDEYFKNNPDEKAELLAKMKEEKSKERIKTDN